MAWLFIVCVAGFAAICAYTDLRWNRVPNYLTVPGAVLALCYHLFASGPLGLGPGLPGLGWSLAGFGIGFAILLIPWMMGGGGAGDVKFLAALGAWLGPRHLLEAFAVAALCGSAIMAGILLANAAKSGMWRTRKRMEAQLTGGGRGRKKGPKRRRIVPFVVALALGAWTILAWLAWSKLGVRS
ncbi:MAG: A24 family peptidase [Thermoguttaceae bacterium]|jgi:prepilin peptidase CpaA